MTHLYNAGLEIQAAFDLGEIPPTDTLDRAVWRSTFCLDLLYDEREIEPEQNLGDMLADLIHYAWKNGVDFDAALRRGERTVYQEREEWGIPHVYQFEKEGS